MPKHNTGIYKITNTVNGKCYVGSAINIKRRFKDHRNLLNIGKHHSLYLQRSWDRYGKEAFKFSILFYCDKDCLLFFEQRAIDICRSSKSNGYNVSPNAENRKGVKSSDETRRRLSESHRGKVSGMKGKHHSPESKLKMSEANTGRVASKETRLKISRARKGKPLSLEHRKKISESRKKCAIR